MGDESDLAARAPEAGETIEDQPGQAAAPRLPGGGLEEGTPTPFLLAGEEPQSQSGCA